MEDKPFAMRPVVRSAKTGKILDLTLSQIGEAVARANTPATEAAALEARHKRYVEEARVAWEAQQRAEASLTTLDPDYFVGQCNLTFAALCELNSDFVITPETTFPDMWTAIIESRPEWFSTSRLHEKVEVIPDEENEGEELVHLKEGWFWEILAEHSVPRKQYFTTRDQVRFLDAEPNKADAYTLAELLAWLKKQKQKPLKSAPLQRTGQPLPELLPFYNDPVHGVTVRAFLQAAHWGPSDGFLVAHQQNYGKAKVTIGLPNGETSQSLWEFLVKGGPRMVKAHYALWARYYEQHEEGGPRFIVINVPQFCADIGLKKHIKGGFRPQQKRDSMKLLEALASIEMRLETTLPNGSKRRIRGPLWSRGAIGEEQDQYADLMGNTREGNPAQWEPVSFSFAPGPFFEDAEWRTYHRFIGKIGAGLMRLSNESDQWAILIAGYLGTLARTNQYRPIRLKVGTILLNADLAQSQSAQPRAKQWQEKLWQALDRLQNPEINVVQSWKLLNTEPVADPVENDEDDVVAWDEYGAKPIYPPGDWRNWLLEITLPLGEERQRLENAQTKAIASAKEGAQKKVRSRSRKSSPKTDSQ